MHEKRSQLSTIPSNPIYPRQSTQPCVPIQSSFPFIKQSHNAHPPSQESHPPTPALQQPRIDVFRSTTGHEISNVPDAAITKFCVAKSHEQHVANTACLKYSNSVYDLLIVKIHSPDLIIILVNRPPSSSLFDFDIITKTRIYPIPPTSTTKHNFAW